MVGGNKKRRFRALFFVGGRPKRTSSKVGVGWRLAVQRASATKPMEAWTIHVYARCGYHSMVAYKAFLNFGNACVPHISLRAMMASSVRLAVISDLHYRTYSSDNECRPAVSSQGVHDDPMAGLLHYLRKYKTSLEISDGKIADYLLCPGDIADKANEFAFDEGWKKLKELQNALGARHLVASTGNHEVNSRASSDTDRAGNVEVEIDPLKTLQKYHDYPTTAFIESNQRWVYWGRGFEFVEDGEVLILLINSSHYHWTTRMVEFERGRLGEIALAELQVEIKRRVANSSQRLFVALLHHHPIPHQHLSHNLGNIEMVNGPRLIEMLEASGVPWLIIHGHKHHARLIPAQGGHYGPLVFAAGTFGAHLSGTLALETRPQFYMIDAALSPASKSEVSILIRALSWTGSDWVWATKKNHGLPDRCGFKLPRTDPAAIASAIRNVLDSTSNTVLKWDQVMDSVAELKYILPTDIKYVQRALANASVNTVWDDDDWFPSEVSK